MKIIFLLIVMQLTSCQQLKDFVSSPVGQEVEQEAVQVIEEIVKDELK